MAAANNPPDQQQRQRALDPERSFLVQAPAGAGKTELLMRRLLALFARVEQPEAVLALTFTKKAAAEMRERVLCALRGHGPGGQPVSAEVAALAAAVRRRDGERGWHLAENPARLRLQTIDAFTSGLAAQTPLGSGLAGRNVQEEAGPFYRQAARALLRELDGSDPALAETRAALRCLLAHLDNDWPRAETLLAELMPKREQWLPHAVGKAGDAAARQALEAGLERVIRRVLVRARAAMPSDREEDIAELARYAAANAPDHPALAACRDLVGWPGLDPMAGFAGWAGIAALFLTGKDGRRQRITVAEGFPAAGAGAKRWKDRWKAAGAALGEEAIAALGAVRHLPAAHYTGAQWEVLAALLRLLPRAAALLDVQFQAAGAADFPANTLAAERALGSEEAPTEIAFAWDARLEHLLVDEFQDTSQKQFELLRKLTGDWQPGDGRTIFLVGDPMQSIYGFRQAKVGLFLQLWEHGRWGRVGLETLRLEANFRSAPVLVGWFNQHLRAAFHEHPDALSEAVPYAPCQPTQAGAPGAAVQFYQLPWLPSPSGRGRADREAEADEVVRLVRQAQAAGENDIAILVRARTHAEAILAVLAAAGIATVEGLDSLGDRPAVRDLLALTRALLRPADRTAWLAVLRAPWCGLTLGDLLIVAEGDGGIWDNCQNTERRKRLSTAGQVALDRCRLVLARALERRGRGPLRRLVEGTWMALGGPAARRNGRADWQDAQAFLDLLESLEAAGGVDVEELENRSRGLRAEPAARDGAVQVMTMHQAKGLEFGMVILPGLDRQTGRGSKELLAWQEIPADAEGHADLLLVPMPAPGAEDPIHDYLRWLQREQLHQEAIRLLYVAATRAKRRLYPLGGWAAGKQPNCRSLAALLAPQGVAPEPVVMAAAAGGEADTESETAVATAAGPRRLPASWKCPAPPAAITVPGAAAKAAAAVSFDWVRPLSRHIGIVVHAWLSAVAGRRDAAPWSDAGIRARLAQEGVAAGDMKAAAERARRAMELVLADERGRWLLAPHDADQREWALAGASLDGAIRHVRLDRSFVHAGERWIVDYKTGIHGGGDRARFLEEERRRYTPQLEGYAALIAAEETQPIRLGLYFPLIEENGRPAWRSWAYVRAAAAPAG